ncbi:putative quinone oxidoreductase [Dissophora ornata]|nr:putative quinone oxidoreductase [Dissophora ornata]
MTSDIRVSEDTSVSFNGWASTGNTILKKFSYHPRPIGPKDVEIEISHCGICGSDIHTITGGWGELKNGPCIPGHEIVGKVVATGRDSYHKIGDLVGVGAMVDACGECDECKSGFDQFCSKAAYTYNATYKDGRGGNTYGGYADRIRVNSEYAFKIPSQISAAEAAPLLCAGITTYAPLKQHGAGPGMRVGVIGIGGLGHLAIQWASALNCDEVVAISTSDSKREESKKLGATKFVNSTKPEDMEAAAASMDLILCTSFADDQDWGKLLALVANHGKLVLLGLPESDLKIHGFSLIGRGVSIGGSLIGGRKAVQEMFDFAAEKNIRPLIEKMPMSDANAAVKHMMEGRPRYRIVLETEAAARV